MATAASSTVCGSPNTPLSSEDAAVGSKAGMSRAPGRVQGRPSAGVRDRVAQLRQRRADEAHAIETEPCRALERGSAQVGPRLDRVQHLPRSRLAQEKLVEDETEVRVARGGIEQDRLRMPLASVEE